jgi:hypothetical protein
LLPLFALQSLLATLRRGIVEGWLERPQQAAFAKAMAGQGGGRRQRQQASFAFGFEAQGGRTPKKTSATDPARLCNQAVDDSVRHFLLAF